MPESPAAPSASPAGTELTAEDGKLVILARGRGAGWVPWKVPQSGIRTAGRTLRPACRCLR
ncbi:hypothetical protein Jiend_42280 [Micromonospora endophytica]|nr:hypothetical protein Jiend_42280 [Micromonospora endophytica]